MISSIILLFLVAMLHSNSKMKDLYINVSLFYYEKLNLIEYQYQYRIPNENEKTGNFQVFSLMKNICDSKEKDSNDLKITFWPVFW